VSDAPRAEKHAPGFLAGARLFTPGIWLCFAAVFSLQFGGYGLYGVVFNLFLRRLGYPVTLIGLANAAAAIGAGVSAIPAGSLGVRWGSRSVVGFGLLAAAVFASLVPLAAYCPPALGTVVVIVAYGLFGAMGMAVGVNVVPFLANGATPATRSSVFTVYGAVTPAGQFLGSAAGGVAPGLAAGILGVSLDRPDPYAWALWTVPVVMLVCGIWFLRLSGTGGEGTATSGPTKGRPPFALFLAFAASNGLRDAAGFATGIFFSLYLDVTFAVRVAVIGTLFAFSRVLPVAATALIPVLTRRFDRLVLIVVLSAGCAVLTLPAGLVASVAAATVSLVGITTLNVMAIPIFASYSQDVSPREWRPLMNGFCGAVDAVSLVAMSFGGGFVVQAIGYRPLFLLSACLTLLSAPVLWIPLRRGWRVSAAS